MDNQFIKKKDKAEPIKLQSLVKYTELSDNELEIVCGGGNLIGRDRHHEDSPRKPKI
jgi:hypothetical protein